MSVPANSRNNYAAIMRVVDANGFLVEPEHLDVRPQLQNIVHPDNQEYVPSNTDNWSRIAWRRLGDSRLWWVIADYSQILDPFTELHSPEKLRYLSRLAVNVPAATTVTQITVDKPRLFQRGQKIRVEDLNPSHKVSFEFVVNTVNESTKTLTFSPVTTPAGGVPFALSRVCLVYHEPVKLVIPAPNRAYFESLNFGNPLNVLTV